MTPTVVRSASTTETRALGRTLGVNLRGGDVLLLVGTIGAGKSVLVRGLGESLGVPVWRGSPTFTLVNEYPTSPALIHVDLYRLELEEVMDLGLEEYMRVDTVVAVEWADRAADYLACLAPGGATWIQIDLLGGDEREITVSRRTPRESPVGVPGS